MLQWVVGVVVGVVVLDRLTWFIGQQVGAIVARKSAGFAYRPHVKIRGGAFLPQLLRWRFKEIRVIGRGLPATPVNISDVDVTVRDVRPIKGLKQARVGALDGVGIIRFRDMAAYVGMKGVSFSRVDDEHLKVRAGMSTPLGAIVPLEVGATSRVSMVDDAIAVEVVKVDYLPPGMNRRVTELINFKLHVRELPPTVHITSLRVLGHGVEAQVRGRDFIASR